MPAPSLTAIPSSMPEPPYPADTVAGSLDFELEWARAKQSRTWRLCPVDLHNHLLRIWAESWNEVPCGSWENDFELIACACDIPPTLLKGHWGLLMRGWELHTDGRLYHPFLTRKTLKMLDTRADWKKKRKRQYDKSVSGDTPESLPNVSLESLPSSSSSSSSSTSQDRNIHPARKIPVDWQPNERSLSWLASQGVNGVDSSRLVVMFRAYWLETEGKRSNWDLTFQRNPVVKGEIFKLKRTGKAEVQCEAGKAPPKFKGGA